MSFLLSGKKEFLDSLVLNMCVRCGNGVDISKFREGQTLYTRVKCLNTGCTYHHHPAEFQASDRDHVGATPKF